MNKLTTSGKKNKKSMKNNRIKKEKENKALDNRLKETFPASDSTAEY